MSERKKTLKLIQGKKLIQYEGDFFWTEKA